MTFQPPPELAGLTPCLTSLAIGLLLGLERERSPAAKVGLRNFSLVALASGLTDVEAITLSSLH